MFVEFDMDASGSFEAEVLLAGGASPFILCVALSLTLVATYHISWMQALLELAQLGHAGGPTSWTPEKNRNLVSATRIDSCVPASFLCTFFSQSSLSQVERIQGDDHTATISAPKFVTFFQKELPKSSVEFDLIIEKFLQALPLPLPHPLSPFALSTPGFSPNSMIRADFKVARAARAKRSKASRADSRSAIAQSAEEREKAMIEAELLKDNQERAARRQNREARLREVQQPDAFVTSSRGVCVSLSSGERVRM